MLNQKFNWVIMAILGLVLSVGCTRKTDEDNSHIELVLPKSLSSSNKLGAQSVVEVLNYVAINVRGDGIPQPIFFNWDGYDQAAPASFALDIPKGNNRLIQILAVYKEMDSASTSSDGGAMKFYYGDVTQNLMNSQESVVIPIVSVGSGTVLSGQISGRYLTSAGAGPTGRVNMVYYPPGAKPSLIVEKAGIFNGWFSFFTLSGATLGYELQDGTKLFGGPVSVESFATSSSVIKAAVPVHLRNNCGGSSSCWRAEEPNFYIYGWFGDVASIGTNKMCKPASLTTLTKIGKYVSPIPASPSLFLNGSSSTIPSVATLIDTAVADPNYYVNGGVTSGSCTGTDYVDQLTFAPLFLDGGGSDNSGVVMGPLKAQISNGYRNQLSSSVSGSTYTFSGEFLPGVAPGVFNGVAVFKRVVADNWEWRGNGAPCEQAASGAFGFARLPDVSVSAPAFSFNVDVPSGTGPDTSVAACFMKDGQITGAGVMLNHYNFTMGGGGTPTPATDYMVQLPSYNFPLMYCAPFKIMLKDGTGNTSNITNSTSLTFALSVSGGATGAAYSDSTCGTLISNLTIPANSSSGEFYVKTTAGASSGMLMATISGFGSPSQSGNFMIASSPGVMTQFASEKKVIMTAANSCQVYDLNFINGNSITNLGTGSTPHTGFTLNYSFTDNLDAGISAPAGVVVQSDCGASPTVYAGSIPAPASSYGIKFALKTTSNDSNYKISFTGTPPSLTAISTSLFVNPTAVANKVAITNVSGATSSGSGNYGSANGACISMDISAVDGSNTVVTVPAGKVLPVEVGTMSSGLIYPSSGCSTGGSNMFQGNITAGQSAVTIYYKTGLSDGTDNVQIKYNDFISDHMTSPGVTEVNFNHHDPMIYASSGPYTFNVPAGVTSITVHLWGAGGGAGGASFLNSSGGAGAGGGAADCTISVTPGEPLDITVGVGGTFGNYVSSTGGGNGWGGQGSLITRSGTDLVVAGGGGGGGGARGDSMIDGGAGQGAVIGVGSINGTDGNIGTTSTNGIGGNGGGVYWSSASCTGYPASGVTPGWTSQLSLDGASGSTGVGGNGVMDGPGTQGNSGFVWINW